MKEFFEAKNIAVIGASRHPEKVGHIIFRNLLKNKNLKVFPVNPNAEKILGVKTYRDVFEIPYNKIDLAVIVVKAEFVPGVLEQCGKKGIKNIVIISAGFREAKNLYLEEKNKKIAENYKMKILGPNILGIINPYRELNASFFDKVPEKGKIAFISQSGALGTSILDSLIQKNLGISGFVSLGNMMQIDFLSALEYFASDSRTEIIILYIESLKEGTGRKFIDLCRKISKSKKIIAIKSGKTEKGKETAKTHTASISTPAEIYSGAFKQAGIIEVKSLRELLFLGEIFSRFKNIGKKACIVSNAGGLGVLCVDELVKAGLEIPEIPENVLKEIDKTAPEGYSRRNPLDILGEALAERYEKVLKILEKESFFDFLIILLSPQAMTQALETAKVLGEIKKPVLACFVGGGSLEEAKEFMKENKIINFEDVGDLRVLSEAT